MEFESMRTKINSRLRAITYKLSRWSVLMSEDDLYQEAVLHLWNRYQTGELGDKNESYIAQSCYFHLRNCLRKTQGKASLRSLSECSNEDGCELEDILSLTTQESSYEYIDARLVVDSLMNNGLTQREKDVCALFLEGLTVRQIGGRLGISHVRVVKIKNNIKRKYSYLIEQ